MGLFSPGRILNIIDYALFSLKRKRAKNISVFLIFTLVIFLFSSFQLVSQGVIGAAEKLLRTTPDITVQQMSAGRQIDISLQAVDRMANIFGIRKIAPRIWGYYFDESNGANYTVVGKGDYPVMMTGVQRAQERDDPNVGEVVISNNVSKLLQLGERVYFSLFRPDLTQKAFKVVGNFDESTDILTGDLLSMSISDARDLFGITEGYVTDLLVTAGNPMEIDTIAKKISERLPGSRVITRKQSLKTYKVVFGWRSGFGMICLLSALVTFSILAWDKASGLSSEDIREIGVLKVIGWQTSDIIALRFCESLLIGGAAFLSGYMLSWIHVALWDGVLYRPILLGWSVLRPAFSLNPTFNVADLIMLVAISLAPYLCATAVPGWRVARVRADSAM